eukprot:352327-Chlamydomonas_euryale.AAC.4
MPSWFCPAPLVRSFKKCSRGSKAPAGPRGVRSVAPCAVKVAVRSAVPTPCALLYVAEFAVCSAVHHVLWCSHHENCGMYGRAPRILLCARDALYFVHAYCETRPLHRDGVEGRIVQRS